MLNLPLCLMLTTQTSASVGLEPLYRLDLLPAYRHAVSIGAVTSYDRSGGNDDGFSGKYSFVRREGDSLVLADLKGPGCIYRIHTPTPTNELIEFYFDGEEKPRLSLPYRELFSGTHEPFVRPLVDGAGGGYYSYLPIPYRKSCKVVLRAKSTQFYDLNYATYPSDVSISSFDPARVDRAEVAKVREVLARGQTSDLTSFNVPAGTRLQRKGFSATLAPGKAVTIFETRQAGRIASLRMSPADAFAGKGRDVLLRITWDGETKPAVFCPAGDFFGYAWGKPSMNSALLGSVGDTAYCNLPMPFQRGAKIELVSLRKSGPALTIKGEVAVGNIGRRPYEGKFYAVWHRESPATEGKPFTWIDTPGKGHIVGLSLQAQGLQPGNTEFFEGDDQTTVDGRLVVHGTGSEDFFNGGWYNVPGRWDAAMSRPLSGCLAYQPHFGRSGGFRFFLSDAYSFDRSILQTIEHGPEGNRTPADYCGVTYLYADRSPAGIPSSYRLQDLSVSDPSEVVFAADWTLPIASFAFADATISRRSVPADGGSVRCLSFVPSSGGDFFSPPFIRFTCELPSAGEYEVFADVVKGPDQGRLRLLNSGGTENDVVDLFGSKPTLAHRVSLGHFSGREGANQVMLEMAGRNLDSKGFGLNLVNVIFVLNRKQL